MPKLAAFRDTRLRNVPRPAIPAHRNPVRVYSRGVLNASVVEAFAAVMPLICRLVSANI